MTIADIAFLTWIISVIFAPSRREFLLPMLEKEIILKLYWNKHKRKLIPHIQRRPEALF